MIIYVTEERPGHNNHEYYWNEYELDGNTIIKYRCRRWKHFDGHENEWNQSRKEMESWPIDDPNMPDWLKNKI